MGELLFPHLCVRRDPFPNGQLTKIVDEMTKASDAGSLSSAFVYFGQFIAHDCLKSDAGLTERQVRPHLGLDSIYDLSRLDVDVVLCGNLFSHETLCKDGDLKGFDFIRHGTTQKALIPEARNEDNRFVGQIHILLQRLHNSIASALENGKNGKRSGTFETAKKLTWLVYQRIIFTDFIPRIIQPKVSELYSKIGGPLLMSAWSKDELPQEFSAAAFRFGHSMVRSCYEINGSNTPIENFFSRVPEPLTPDAAFLLLDLASNFAERIDLHLASAMRLIPDRPEDHNVPWKNLRASEGLPTGHSIVDDLAGHPTIGLLFRGYRPPVIRRFPFNQISFLDHDNLPLWLYILMEARQQARGRRLGVLGSVIVCEALLHAAQAVKPNFFDKEDYLRKVLGDKAVDLYKRIPANLIDLIRQMDGHQYECTESP